LYVEAENRGNFIHLAEFLSFLASSPRLVQFSTLVSGELKLADERNLSPITEAVPPG
jgi:hypothetical protein